MPALPLPDERIFLRQIREVTCGCCGRRAGDSAVLAGTHAAFESFRPFLEHSNERFLLPVVQLSTDAVEQLRLVDQELDECKGAPLRFTPLTNGVHVTVDQVECWSPRSIGRRNGNCRQPKV